MSFPVCKVDKRIRWAAAILWMTLIFALSHQANSGRMTEAVLGDFNVAIRKLGHVTEYLVLYILLFWALLPVAGRKPGGNDVSSGRAESCSIGLGTYLICLVLTISYAASDEFHQNFVAGRSSSARDVLVDSGGAILGLLICRGLSLWKVDNQCES